MELFQARDNYIIKDGYYSLWCNRIDGGIVARQGVPPTEAFDPVCKGKVYGIIGKIQLFPGTEWKLLVITKRTLLGLFPGNHEVYRIDRIAVLPLAEGDVTELELDLCDKHQAVGKPKGSGDGQQKGFERTWQSMKIAVTNMKDNVKNTNMQKDIKDKEKDKLERRLLEEIFKMFNDSDSFIYSPTGDITNTQQKQCGEHYNSSLPQWKRVDERFFWNKYMLQDLVNNEDPLDLCSRWIIPVVQGYCQIVHCVNKFEEEEPDELIEKNRGELPEEEFELILISRRSIHRAGTRYKRRGVDEDGEVANFVETEQIIRTEIHSVSFVQVRGSVPIYWSQPGFKYRPPPRLDKGEEETLLAFMSHFAHQLKYYGGVVIVNLLDQTGREQIIGDALMENILMFNNPLLTYVTYDFHEYCRGMKFENVAILVDSINDIIKEMRYCWTDAKGIICEQRSVFRVNCMDCLDRTNVVQAALGRHVMEVQLRKLGKLLPDQNLPSDIRASFQEMWANNGDAISRQYAGTAAMKGDFTRTGERNFKGLMKDGYNSANRYYLNRFKAVYRQTVIDAMLGNPLTEDLTQAMAALKNGDEEYPWTMEREECVAQLVVHCQHLLLADTEECLGGWALVDPFYNSEGDLIQDQDVILLLTHDAYFVASYDDDEEQITQYECIALEDVEKIEIGFEPSFKTRYLFIRIHHKLNGTSGYFHTLRTIQHRTPDEARGVLLGIANTFTTAPANKSLGIKISECNKLDKKKSKGPPEVTQISSESRLSGWSKPNKPKNLIDIDIDEEDTPITRAKSSSGVFHSFLRDHLTGMPRPYSDPCLARQNEDEYKPERKKSGHSAPVSSGSSSSSSSDDEGTFKGKGGLAMRLDKEKPLKSATKLVCRSDDVLTSTRTDDDNEEKTKNNQNVNVDELIQINTEESDDLVASPKDENQSENTTLSENINGNNLSGLETSNEDTKATQQDTKEEQITTNTSDLSNNLENQDAVIESENQSTGLAVNSTESQASGEQNSRNTKFSKENCVAVNCTENQESGEQGTRNTEFPNCVAPSVDITEENNIETEIVPCIGDEKSNKVECATSDLKEHSSETECLLDIGGEKSDTVKSTNAGKENQDDIHELECNFATKEIKDDFNDAGTQLIDFEDIPKIRESYIESKKKLRNENTDLLNLKEDQESSTQETSKPIGTSPLVRLGLGGGRRSMTVSFKSSSSIEKEDQVNTTENTTEQEANKRDSTGLLGNRSPSTSRSGKGNIFASAQARSKNFIPDLRNKLSNISFQRSKSPRLAHKQLSTDPGTNDEPVVENHKKHKRKHKCLTRIIEI